MTIKNIQQNILKLTALKRIKIVEAILESLDKPDPKIERAWVAESEKRFSAYKKGKIKAVPVEDLKKRLY